jgi:GNAT superfamily N-acetyltransferase
MKTALHPEPPHRYFKFEHIGGVEECRVAEQEDGGCRLIKLKVAREMQGRGIGGKVLMELKRMYRRIELVAYPDDPDRYEDCRRFYRWHGFVEQEGTGDFVWTR